MTIINSSEFTLSRFINHIVNFILMIAIGWVLAFDYPF
jgi:hypothetical protein